jgi:acetyl-CoA carboxylase biotin carboxyl carrier protein
MDIRKIKTLIEMLEESDLNEIEVCQGEESVRISKGQNRLHSNENNQSIQEDIKLDKKNQAAISED